MEFITQLASLPGGSSIISILFISGLGLLLLVALGGWGKRNFSKNWKIIFTIVAIILILFSVLCYYIIASNPPTMTEQVLQSVPEHYSQEGDNKDITTMEMVDKTIIIIFIACIPGGLLLILFSILFSQRFTEKQQKDLCKYGIILIIGSFYLIYSMLY